MTVKTDFLEINVLEHIQCNYNYTYIFFFGLPQSCINVGSNGHGSEIIFKVKIVFTNQKFFALGFKIHSKTVTEIRSKTGKKVTTVPKMIHL